MSDTPRTDAKEVETLGLTVQKHAHYGWKFARTLERELTAATRERDEARLHADAEAGMCDLVAKERDALRAEVGGLRHALSRALVEMRHANDVMLREAGVGVIDINTISLAKAALLEPLQEPTPLSTDEQRVLKKAQRASATLVASPQEPTP